MVKNDKRLEKLPTKYRSYVRKEMRDMVDFLEKERVARNISRFDFAEEINISFKTLQAIEQGTRKPSLEVLLAMCKALGVKIKLG